MCLGLAATLSADVNFRYEGNASSLSIHLQPRTTHAQARVVSLPFHLFLMFVILLFHAGTFTDRYLISCI